MSRYEADGFPQRLVSSEFGAESDYVLQRMEGAASSLNRAYWAFRDHVLAPTVSLDGTEAVRINVFKILSGKELATAHDYIWTLDKDVLDEQEARFELYVNAHFGFYVAMAFTLAWDWPKVRPSFESKFGQIVRLEDITDFTFNDDYPMNLLREHVTVIANSLRNTRSNAIHNATWWRAFSLFIHDRE